MAGTTSGTSGLGIKLVPFLESEKLLWPKSKNGINDNRLQLMCNLIRNGQKCQS